MHQRNVAGSIEVTCERNEGRPCGGGASTFGEVDSAGGYGNHLSFHLRLRGQVGTDSYDEALVIDRAYVDGTWRAVLARVGRDVLAIGPSSRTQLGWSHHAPPLDHALLTTPEPISLGDTVSIAATYAVARARAPQRYPDPLLTISRVELHVQDSVSFGLIQLLQLGGDGAPDLGAWDFIAEHIRRKDMTATELDTSNRRFGGDVVLRVPELSDLRLYYALVFEDIRRLRLIDAVRYDADHLLGLELQSFEGDARHGAIVEYVKTGVRSHEHFPRTTGFTHAGRIVGAALGPDAESLYAGARIGIRTVTLVPWLELARLSSDTYEIINNGPINRLSHGVDEGRYRLGARVCVPVRHDIVVNGEVLFERIDDFAFAAGETRNHGGVIASVMWQSTRARGTLDTKACGSRWF